MDATFPTTDWHLKLLYDGDCPLCVKEIGFLRRRDRQDRLAFEDITQPGFDAAAFGLERPALDAEMHAVLPDGRVLRRVAVFREAYRLVGLGWLVSWTAWPGFAQIADLGYSVFARYRVRIGRLFGRTCDDGSCSIR